MAGGQKFSYDLSLLSVGFPQRRPLNTKKTAIYKLPCSAIDEPPCVQLINNPILLYIKFSHRQMVCESSDTGSELGEFQLAPLRSIASKTKLCWEDADGFFGKRFLGKRFFVGRPLSTNKKFVRERGPQNWNPEVFDQTRCSRTFACRSCPA